MNSRRRAQWRHNTVFIELFPRLADRNYKSFLSAKSDARKSVAEIRPKFPNQKI